MGHDLDFTSTSAGPEVNGTASIAVTDVLSNHSAVTATVSISNPAGVSALTVGTNNGSSTFDGVIQDAAGGPGSLVKTGGGVFELTGANTYSGGTAINAGTLLANNPTNSTGTGGVAVNNGGTLSGTGVSAGTTTVNDGGTVAPGASVGALIVGDIFFNEGSTFAVEISGDGGVAGVDFDQLIVNNTAALGGDLVIELIGEFTPSELDSFTVLTADTLTEAFDNVADGARLDTLGGVGSFLVSYDDATNQVVLSDFMPGDDGIPGDFDMDGDVDGADFLLWQRNPGVGSLFAWQNHYGESTPLAARTAAVPEPCSVGILLSGMLVLLPRRFYS